MATNKTISADQRFELFAKLGAHTDWGSLDSSAIQEFIDHPGNPGQQLTLFLKNGCRISLGGMRVATASFDPIKFVGQGWKIIAEEHDKRNDGLTEVDFNQVDFATCLKEGETSVTGEEKLKRLKALEQILYGVNAFMGLWQDYQTRKENSVLEALSRAKGIAYPDFPGDVLLDPRGDRFVLRLCRNDDGRWYWSCHRLGGNWGAGDRSVVSSQVVV